jgi:hypothetical protein
MVNGRLTDQEVKDTVAAARMRDAEKAVLLKRALAGHPESRFAVAWLKRRQDASA